MVSLNIVIQPAVFVALFVTVGPWHRTQVFGLATLLTLVVQDTLILSQHTELPMENSQLQEVKPFPALARFASTGQRLHSCVLDRASRGRSALQISGSDSPTPLRKAVS